MNTVILSGRLARDPEISYGSSTGNAMTRFSIAVDKRLSREKKQELQSRNMPTADFIHCVAWGKLAESIHNFSAKGKRVIVQGRIQTGSYTAQDGTKRYTTDIVVENIEFTDWKDRDGSYSNNGNYGNSNGNARETAPTDENRKADDDFFGGEDKFNPLDDPNIPF